MSPATSLHKVFESSALGADQVLRLLEVEEKFVVQFPKFHNPSRQGFFLQSLLDELVAEYASPLDPYTKNLVSIYGDTPERDIERNDLSFRIRHEESKYVDEDGHKVYKRHRGDMSLKAPIHSDSRLMRGEFEVNLASDAKGNFLLSRAAMMNEVRTRIDEFGIEDPLQAKAIWDRINDNVPMNLADLREYFSINCKRTQVYVELYARTEEDSSVTLLTKPEMKALVEEQKSDGYKALGLKKLVFEFCFDTNRFFSPAALTGTPRSVNGRPIQVPLVGRDFEIEFEFKAEKCAWTPNAKASDENFTPREVAEAFAHLKSYVHQSCARHGIEIDKDLSGKSKHDRGMIYLRETVGPEPEKHLLNAMTLRGSTEGFKVARDQLAPVMTLPAPSALPERRNG
jgi:hypothetical protein